MGLSQLRKGPNKVSLGGLLQPIRDAVKLFLKEVVLPYKIYVLFFIVGPCIGLRIIIILWILMPRNLGYLRFSYSISLFLVFLGISIYPLFFAGWSRIRKYALIGATRGIAQSVSYEIRLALLILRILCIRETLQINDIILRKVGFNYIVIRTPLILLWLVCCVAETNRSPFDFAEGESELVSGFNIEYGSGGFALIFIAEYARILFLRYLTGGLLIFPLYNIRLSVLLIIILGGVWVWLRCTYPRYRYDKLINLAWKWKIHPFSWELWILTT